MEFSAGVRVVVVLDTCHSGSMFKGGGDASSGSGPWNFAASVEAYMDEMRSSVRKRGAKAAASGPSVGWVTACDDDQLSVESNKRGWFTRPFVEAWKADATDANGDGWNDFKEAFNIAAPKATNTERAPQTFNEDLLRSVAAYEVAYHPKASDKWLDETMEMRLSTGTWSEDVAYGEDGRAYLDSNGGEIAFSPCRATRRSRTAATRCGRGSPAGRRSTGATRSTGRRSSATTSTMSTACPSGSTQRYSS